MGHTGNEYKVLYIYDGEEAIPLGKGYIDGDTVETMMDDILSPKACDLLIRNEENTISVGIDGERIVVNRSGRIRRPKKE